MAVHIVPGGSYGTDYDKFLGDGFDDIHMYHTMQDGNGFSTVLKPLIPFAGEAIGAVVRGKLKGKSNMDIAGDVGKLGVKHAVKYLTGGGLEDPDDMDTDPGETFHPTPRKRRRTPRVARPIWAA